MKIYFGKVAEDLVDNDNEWFKHDGVAYEYELELSEEGFILRDVCGRAVPFSYSNVEELISASIILDNYTKPLQRAEATLERILSDEIRST